MFCMTIFFFFFFFFNHLYLELAGRESIKNNQAKIQFKSKIRILNQDILKVEDKNQTWSRFKDLLEEDSRTESRPDPNHILAFTETNHQFPGMISYNVIHKNRKWNEAENVFFSSPKNETDFSQRRKNESSLAQQGSTLKRNFKNYFTVQK